MPSTICFSPFSSRRRRWLSRTGCLPCRNPHIC